MEISGNNTDKAAVHLTRNLYNLSQDEIIGFEFKLTEKLIEADHFNVMIPLKIMLGSVTDDPYLYFRCWLIFQGKEVFENTLRNPDTLVEHVNTDVFPFAEPLLYVATNAYSEVTGIKQENDSFPRNRTVQAELSYDNGFIATKGEDWEESDLPKRAPRLWKMFNIE